MRLIVRRPAKLPVTSRPPILNINSTLVTEAISEQDL